MTAGPTADEQRDAASRRVIAEFYEAFAHHDADAMVALYVPDATFHDPAFGHLEGPEVAAMWRMLLSSATDLEVSVRNVTARGDLAAATWEARYTFSGTGRRVLNVVEAHMTLEEGRIRRHDDHFDFWRWSRQALGPVGLLLGWTPILRIQVQRRARTRLEEFMSRGSG